MRIKATITYEYDVVPAHYGPNWGSGDREPTPTEMAKMDIETDPVAMLMGEGTIEATEVFPGYHDTGYGCKTCGCRNAMVECAGLYCVPCYQKAHPDV